MRRKINQIVELYFFGKKNEKIKYSGKLGGDDDHVDSDKDNDNHDKHNDDTYDVVDDDDFDVMMMI